MRKQHEQLAPEIEEPRIMNPSNPSDTGPNQSLIPRPSSGLLGLPEGRSAPLEEMILRSLDHLSETAGLIVIEPLQGEERDFEIAPGVKMRMCWCPPGEFIMGSPKEERRGSDERQVRVFLSKGFWIGKTQVTQAQWQAVMGNNPSKFKGGNRPVERVNWHDTQEFLERANLLIGNTNGERLALPTEAQWEYAGRAGHVGVYACGNLDDLAWHHENSGRKTHPVGTKKANAWGLHDMLGNVSEWCHDWYENWRVRRGLSGGIDPLGPNAGTGRVIRGGGWINRAMFCRVAKRRPVNPVLSRSWIGFRVTRSSVP